MNLLKHKYRVILLQLRGELMPYRQTDIKGNLLHITGNTDHTAVGLFSSFLKGLF